MTQNGTAGHNCRGKDGQETKGFTAYALGITRQNDMLGSNGGF